MVHKLLMAVSSAQWRSFSCALLPLEGEPSQEDDEACESCLRSDAEHETWHWAATLAKAEWMLIMLDDLRSPRSQWIACDATAWSLPM
jgi:hypothetical protein